uniref:Variant surface glycoprotein 1125.5757 n=1 Tax=Trypanosoma brucei TaxID=5691 RepID=A0A1J0RDC2_9TRYP|nr:variant surface glycoprotein 1125.5757 [Trypanosoma brucei]
MQSRRTRQSRGQNACPGKQQTDQHSVGRRRNTAADKPNTFAANEMRHQTKRNKPAMDERGPSSRLLRRNAARFDVVFHEQRQIFGKQSVTKTQIKDEAAGAGPCPTDDDVRKTTIPTEKQVRTAICKGDDILDTAAGKLDQLSQADLKTKTPLKEATQAMFDLSTDDEDGYNKLITKLYTGDEKKIQKTFITNPGKQKTEYEVGKSKESKALNGLEKEAKFASVLGHLTKTDYRNRDAKAKPDTQKAIAEEKT